MASEIATTALPFAAVSARLVRLEMPPCDVVVGIATGGTVPAALLAHQLDRPLALVTINFRAADNSPQRPRPELLGQAPRLPAGTRVLLVDEASVTGATLATAAALFTEQQVTTLVLKGQADVVAFPEIDGCVAWPWKP
jgi:uncharacterized protein